MNIWWSTNKHPDFSAPSDIQNQTGSTGLYRCATCNRTYKYKTGLLQHVKYECGKEAMFQCQFCPHRTKQKGNLKLHTFAKHGDLLSKNTII